MATPGTTLASMAGLVDRIRGLEDVRLPVLASLRSGLAAAADAARGGGERCSG